MVIVAGEAKLLQIVFALCSACGLTGLLNGWQQQRDENGNDRNHDQQFNERKRSFGGTLQLHPGTFRKKQKQWQAKNRLPIENAIPSGDWHVEIVGTRFHFIFQRGFLRI